ncbi:hypothetical protein BLA15945_04473 [Burkholderia lata]|uniref:Uncharacterized protein n=1 Tax=Burkholderia lata (strain ATCC 17760 / DSM 23089 / LMG 22485 / NCIMB 9086 / R18194 / 383) TaxID=482957 RepID=A0A6P2NGX1_BURL3|nr:hypothetical protein BLA15945_04473 [Burkholderia lata]
MFLIFLNHIFRWIRLPGREGISITRKPAKFLKLGWGIL